MPPRRRTDRRGAAARLLAAIALAAVVALPTGPGLRAAHLGPPAVAGAPAGARSDAGPASPGPPAGEAPRGSAPLARTTDAPAGPRNVPVDDSCNATDARAPVEAADPAIGALYVAFEGCGGIGFSRSIDGGYSFGPAATVPGSAATGSSDPALAVLPNGTVLVAYVANSSGAPTLRVAGSGDHGSSFGEPATVLAAGAGGGLYRPSLAVSPNGTVAAAVTVAPNASAVSVTCPPAGPCYATGGALSVVVAVSSDGGATWAPAVPVPPVGAGWVAVAGRPAWSASGSLDVAVEAFPWAGGTASYGNGSAAVSASPDGGASFAVPLPVANATFVPAVGDAAVSLAIDAGGALYVGFTATNGSADDALLTASTDGGSNWTSPQSLDPASAGSAHRDVTVAAGAAGSAWAAWLVENGSGGGWNVAVAPATSNGTAIGAPAPVANATGLAAPWVGDALGAVDLGGGAVAVAFALAEDGPSGPAVRADSAVVGETAPADAPPTVYGAAGPGTVTIGWQPPVGPSDRVGGFLLEWGLADQRIAYTLAFAPAASFGTATGIPPDLEWGFDVRATNGAGAGPPSRIVLVTLTNWGIVRGSVDPAAASVTVDGAAAPVAAGAYLVNTSAGLHLVGASAPGYAAAYATLTVAWNGTGWANFTLVEEPGTINGTVVPADAAVLVDGGPVAVNASGGYSAPDLAAGVHRVEAAAAGYATASENVTVVAGATVYANLTLVPLNGTIHVAVDPATANVTVGGTRIALSAAGQANVSVRPGTYAVRATAPGYLPGETNVTVAAATTYSVPLRLVPVPPAPPPASPAVLVPLLLTVGVAVVAVACVVGGVVWLQRRRRARPAGPLWESDEPGEAPASGSGLTEGPDAPR